MKKLAISTKLQMEKWKNKVILELCIYYYIKIKRDDNKVSVYSEEKILSISSWKKNTSHHHHPWECILFIAQKVINIERSSVNIEHKIKSRRKLLSIISYSGETKLVVFR